MAEKGFGVKEINLIGASGTPTIESPNNLNLNAVNVAISTNVSIGGTLTVSGNLSIGGTITYEDVTNVDAIGIITARAGVNLTGGNITLGDSGGSSDDRISIGAGGDINIYHDGTDSYVSNATGDLRLFSVGGSADDVLIRAQDDIELQPNNGQSGVKVIGTGAVELYHNNNKKLETSSSGATVTGTLAATAVTGDGSALTGIAVTEAPVTDYTITANGASAYRFHGGGVNETEDNPDLYLIRGQKYRFNNTTGSGHPFAIREASGGSAYSNGVTGSQNGIQFFTVPYDAPAKIFYQCTIHGGMVGNIYLRGGNGNETNVGVTTFSGTIHANETGDAKGIRIHSNGGISATNNELRFNTGQSSGFTFMTNSDGGSSNERLRITSAGKIGINQTSPYSDVDITSSVEGGSDTLAAHGIRLSAIGATDEQVIPITAGFRTQQDRVRAGIGFISKQASGTDGLAGAIGFYTRSSADGNVLSRSDERLRITSAGNIGINTVNPSSKLEINEGVIDSVKSAGWLDQYDNTSLRIFNNLTARIGVYTVEQGDWSSGMVLGTIDGSTTRKWGIGMASNGKSAYASGLYIGYRADTSNTGQNTFNLMAHSLILPTTGDVRVQLGNLVLGTNNKGISFANSSSSSDADSTSSTRVITDYDEGTTVWELHRSDGLTTGSNTADTKVTYTKIGNRVYISGYVYTQSTGGTTGVTARLTDASGNAASLPYTPNHHGILPICHTRTIAEYERMSVSFVSGSKTVYVHTDEGNNAYQPNTNNVNIGSPQTHLVIAFTGSYTTDE